MISQDEQPSVIFNCYFFERCHMVLHFFRSKTNVQVW